MRSGSLQKSVAAAFADVDEDDLDGLDDEDLADLAGITELIEVWPDRLDAVSMPASGYPALMAKGSREPRRVLTRIIKASDEKRATMHVAYPSGRPDVARAADGARDFAQPSALEAGAWAFLAKGAKVGTDHMPGTEGAGTVVESWIHRAPPWTMTAVDKSQQTVHPGDWCVVVQWGPAAWERFKNGELTGVSMQGGAVRKKPSREALAGLRKQRAEEDIMATLAKAARSALKESTAPVLAQLGDLGKRMDKIEKSRRPRCAGCGKASKVPGGGKFCVRCGARLGAVAKSTAAPAGLGRVARLVQQARDADPSVRDPALGALTDRHGPDLAIRVLAGTVTARDLAKAAQEAEDDLPERTCPVCAGQGRVTKPASGRAGRVCEGCGGSGTVAGAPGAPDVQKVARLAAKAIGGDVDALGRLVGQVGPVAAGRLLTGEAVSPGEFTRGYVSAGRARLSAAPGQSPRIPQAAHVISAEDFQRGPIGLPRQQSPSPASVIPRTAGMGRPPLPGEARPW